MKNKTYKSITIIIAVISIIVVCVCHVKTNETQKKVDDIFLQAIDDAMQGFGIDYNKISSESKEMYYIKTASNLKVARELTLITSYNEKNKYLVSSLNNLYLCMTDKYSRQVIINAKGKVFRYLLEIQENPRDIEKAKEFNKFVGNVYFTRTKE